MSNKIDKFDTLEEIAKKFRKSTKKYTLLFAHNGTGKTRLSTIFKDLGNKDTLYFNAFTEDLFNWDNDLENDTLRTLNLNISSTFFNVFDRDGFDIETRIQEFLKRYDDFNFDIDIQNKKVSFSREINQDDKSKTISDIKISRGEENIFIWCFFLAIVQMALDNDEKYQWVKYIYIDDPISSLDDNNVITVASHLAKLLKDSKDSSDKKFIISTHHGLFYNVMFNELKNADKYLLKKNPSTNGYMLETLTKDTPFYQHISILQELKKIADDDKIYTYHFNLLRNILEKTASFHGFDKFSDCIKIDTDDTDKTIHARRINILSHGNYSIFEPMEMQDENKEHFKNILDGFIEKYGFNNDLFLTSEDEK